MCFFLSAGIGLVHTLVCMFHNSDHDPWSFKDIPLCMVVTLQLHRQGMGTDHVHNALRPNDDVGGLGIGPECVQ